MRISKVWMPALTVAGALALAGCGGGSGGTPTQQQVVTPCSPDYGRNTDGSCKTLAQRDAERDAQRDATTDDIAYARELDALRQSPVLNAKPTQLRKTTGNNYAGQALRRVYRGYIDDTKGTGATSKLNKLTTTNNDGHAWVDAVENAAAGHINFGTTGGATATPGVAQDGFPTGGSRATRNSGATITGKYYGLDGTYSCNADGCTTERIGSGVRLVGDWHFTPSGDRDGDKTVTKPDTNYLEFGWWIAERDGEPVNVDGNNNGDVAIYLKPSTGLSPLAADGTAWRPTKATYEGDAAGYYRKYVSNPEAGEHGAFTAKASLAADFKSDGGTTTGTIDGFMVNGTDRGWVVTLGEKPILDTLATDFEAANVRGDDFLVWRDRGGTEIGGYGYYGVVAYGTGTPGTNKVPSELGGVFTVEGGGSELAGSFATTEKK